MARLNGTKSWKIRQIECPGTIRSNVIAENQASQGQGGGMAGSGGVIVNNSIIGNSAFQGGGVTLWGGTIKNCIIWGNAAMEDARFYGTTEPSHCCIQWWNGGAEANIGRHPRKNSTRSR